ncbi:MAG: Uma2 family endonuclease [Bryobacteraceae bacterium]
MIASAQDLAVRTRADWESLPAGRWEVVDGRAILLPPPTYKHQRLSDRLVAELNRQLESQRLGYAASAVGVFVPPLNHSLGEVQSRIPDIVVSSKQPEAHFEEGSPPELVIEILSTRRGSVERTEKLDDYARAGVGEYWIVNPIDRIVETHVLKDGDYVLEADTQVLRPKAFPGTEIDMRGIWPVLD